MKKAAKKSTGRGTTAKKAKKKATAARSKAKATASGKKNAGTKKKTSATRAKKTPKKATRSAARSKSSRKAPDVTTQALAVAQETIQHFDTGSLNRVRIGLAKLIRILSGEDDQS